MSPSTGSRLAQDLLAGILGQLEEDGIELRDEFKPRLVAVATDLSVLYTRQLAGEDVGELLEVARARLANLEAAAGIAVGRIARDQMVSIVTNLAKTLLAVL